MTSEIPATAETLLKQVALDCVAAGITEPTTAQIADIMLQRINRNYELGCWLTGTSEAARTMRTLLGSLVFLEVHERTLAERLS